MQLRNSIAIAAAAGLAACAAQQAPVDNSPENPTAVLETLVVNGGIAGMFPFEMNEKQWVRSNMRRDERNLKGTGTFSGFLVTRLVGGGDAAITRLDQDKLWMLNLRRKEYLECPAHGCPLPPAATQEEKKREDEAAKQEPKQQTEEGCTARITSNNFDVKSTGQKKNINGFDSSQYTAAWVLKLQDQQRRTTTSTVSVDVWTTPLSPQIREAFGVEQAYGRAYFAGQRRAAAASPDRAQVMPEEVTKMMSSYLASLRPADRAALANAGKQLAKVQGHPVYTHIEWLMEGDACGDKGANEQPSAERNMGGMLGAMGSLLGGKKDEKPAGPKPLLSFTIEVKALGVQPVRDSVFAVPFGYKRTN
jgi:hypothetical protein